MVYDRFMKAFITHAETGRRTYRRQSTKDGRLCYWTDIWF